VGVAQLHHGVGPVVQEVRAGSSGLLPRPHPLARVAREKARAHADAGRVVARVEAYARPVVRGRGVSSVVEANLTNLLVSEFVSRTNFPKLHLLYRCRVLGELHECVPSRWCC